MSDGTFNENDLNEMRPFRSRLNELPLEMRYELAELSEQIGLPAEVRYKKAKEILDTYHIDWLEVGTGTNRFIIKYDGYVIKIALDQEGVADNKQEYAICESLMPDVAYAHEVSPGGHFLVATYCPAFTTANEMWAHAAKIRSILKNWGNKFLLGDVGLDGKNYANWGLDVNGNPVCIDYAYLFPADMNLFVCSCGCKSMGFANTQYTKYKCISCGQIYEDRDLRMRISVEHRINLFNNAMGQILTKPVEMKPVEQKYLVDTSDPDPIDPLEIGAAIYDRINGIRTADWGC